VHGAGSWLTSPSFLLLTRLYCIVLLLLLFVCYSYSGASQFLLRNRPHLDPPGSPCPSCFYNMTLRQLTRLESISRISLATSSSLQHTAKRYPLAVISTTAVTRCLRSYQTSSSSSPARGQVKKKKRHTNTLDTLSCYYYYHHHYYYFNTHPPPPSSLATLTTLTTYLPNPNHTSRLTRELMQFDSTPPQHHRRRTFP
jgi:hypothetical protein